MLTASNITLKTEYQKGRLRNELQSFLKTNKEETKMALPIIPLPEKDELKQRLLKLIPAKEIEREEVFYLHGLMFFTKEHLREADAKKIAALLMMTMGANLTSETQSQKRPIDIESVIDAIVGENKKVGDALKEGFNDLIMAYRSMKASKN